MGNRVLDRAIDQLGAYYGLRGRDTFLRAVMDQALTAEDVDSAGDPTKTQKPMSDEDSITVRSEILRQISASGVYAPTTQAIFNFIKESGVDVKEVAEDICITPSEDIKDGDNVSIGPVNKLEVELAGGVAKDQGLGAPYDGAEYYSSIEGATVTSKISPSSAGSKCVNVIQIFPASADMSASDTDIVTVFFNSLSTLEMSRAIPYIDINVVAGFPKGGKKTRMASLGMFLEGNEMKAEDVKAGILNSEDLLLTPDPEKGNKVAFGMEAFTSPQTMVGARYLNRDSTGDLVRYDENASDIKVRPKDPFRPFLSLQGISATNKVFSADLPSNSFTLDVNLILHDVSRLAQIAPLVRPGKDTGYKWSVRFGWSHPAGSSKYGSAAAGGRFTETDPNRIGELIDAMQSEALYGTLPPEVSIDGGQAEVKLKMTGIGNAQCTDPGYGDILSDVSVPLRKWMENVLDPFLEKMKSDAMPGTAPAKLSKDYISAKPRSTFAKPLVHVKVEFLKDVLKAMQDYNEQGDHLLRSEINSFLLKIVGEKGNGKNNDDSDAEWIKYKVDPLESLGGLFYWMRKGTADPYFTPCGNKQSDSAWPMGTMAGRIERWPDLTYDILRDNKVSPVEAESTWNDIVNDLADHPDAGVPWVSLGKVLSTFVGRPIGSLPSITEVQLIFYSFNMNASYMWENNIAQFPIHIATLEKTVLKAYKASGSMTPSQLMDIVFGMVSDPNHPAYGFSRLGDLGKKQKGGYEKLPEKLKEKKHQQVLVNAYGLKDSESDPTMTVPFLDYSLETMPACDALLTNPDNRPDSSRSICKIHIFDKHAQMKPMAEQILNAADGVIVELNRSRSKDSPRIEPIRYSKWDSILSNEESFLSSIELIVPIEDGNDEWADTPVIEGRETEVASVMSGRYKLNTDASYGKFKRAMASLYPTLVVGGATSGIFSAKFSSGGSSKAQEKLTGDYVAGLKGSQDVDQEKEVEPINMVMTKLEIECFGCPYIKAAQKYFIDFGTNTDMDNVWTVSKVEHEIGAGSFVTKVEFSLTFGAGKLTGMYSTAKKKLAALRNPKKE